MGAPFSTNTRKWSQLATACLLLPLLAVACDSEGDDPFASDDEFSDLEVQLADLEVELADASSEASGALDIDLDPGTSTVVHPLRSCWANFQCANQCGCIGGYCRPHGVSPLPPQEHCSYPPEFYAGDYVSCSNSSDCADHCLCNTTGSYGNYCKPFGVGPHPPLSSCEPDDGGGSAGGSGGLIWN